MSLMEEMLLRWRACRLLSKEDILTSLSNSGCSSIRGRFPVRDETDLKINYNFATTRLLMRYFQPTDISIKSGVSARDISYLHQQYPCTYDLCCQTQRKTTSKQRLAPRKCSYSFFLNSSDSSGRSNNSMKAVTTIFTLRPPKIETGVNRRCSENRNRERHSWHQRHSRVYEPASRRTRGYNDPLRPSLGGKYQCL